MAHKSSLIRVMEDAAFKAGRALSHDFGEVENLQVSMKGPGDFVTSADKRSESILVRELQKARPKFGFLLEESGEIKGEDGEYRWIIDPLDGTKNFMHGVPYFSISIGLEKRNAAGKGEIVAGVIHAPVMNEFFWAEKGVGAYYNKTRMIVSARTKLEESLLATSLYPRNNDDERNKNALNAMKDHMRNIRLFGSAALELAYVAAGKLEAYWHNYLMPWDLAAGMLMVVEARGIITEIDGGSDIMKNGNILASNGHIHDKIRSIIGKFYAK